MTHACFGKSTWCLCFVIDQLCSFGEQFLAAQSELIRQVSNLFGAFKPFGKDSSPFGGATTPFGDPFGAEWARIHLITFGELPSPLGEPSPFGEIRANSANYIERTMVFHPCAEQRFGPIWRLCGKFKRCKPIRC